MLESAKVTLSYKELKELVDKADMSETLDKENLRLEKELEDKTERKAPDKVLDILVKASNCKTLKGKQTYIEKCIEIYCKFFNIPMKELLISEEK
ncbi:hypothetical protein [Clostridium sp. JN-1]|uniref:hypothetical protein n=1 Tax=Clostridium sp. JN-1 TaxID=2483110 RepID=UPI000F0B04C2|nr:hypothetical protein [Clostridium sp. JN-1]